VGGLYDLENSTVLFGLHVLTVLVSAYLLQLGVGFPGLSVASSMKETCLSTVYLGCRGGRLSVCRHGLDYVRLAFTFLITR